MMLAVIEKEVMKLSKEKERFAKRAQSFSAEKCRYENLLKSMYLSELVDNKYDYSGLVGDTAVVYWK